MVAVTLLCDTFVGKFDIFENFWKHFGKGYKITFTINSSARRFKEV